MFFDKYYGLNTLCETPSIHVRTFVHAIISYFHVKNKKDPLKSWTLRSMRQR